ncbi:MAG: ATP-binding protein [Ardenticatenales bacterium]|nr:ATP-binding protein [Ardenticatenales bacterium]
MPSPADFEKLGTFYLGRTYDMTAKKATDELLLYDANDLTTHALCIGMTGSGKTGLCISLIEEALLDGVPALIIDPKGDLTNLMLTFPELRPADFEPWVNPDDAVTAGVSVGEFAAQQASLWQKGLADWGQDGARIAQLRRRADIAIYTPGSSAGIPISILKSFGAPPPALVDDADLLRERVTTTATSLLSLLGIDADPLRSREHILVARIFEDAWRAGRDVGLAELIGLIQRPPFATVGALATDAFYAPDDRHELAMRLNNLLAAPGFDVWLSGEALDIDQLLHDPAGRPRAAILTISHLSDAERMFFVSLLLNEVLGWVRLQSGTTSLRAILYMDEIFGFFPPTANPPSKTPLLALLKQARAFGLGIVLATQNPVDLDYKGLSNIGTWLIGRLQTDRDKQRILDGLEGAAAGAGRFDRAEMEETLAGLGKRVFLMNNVHENAPVIFTTRWAMSYLRGPLARDQIKRLMAGRKPTPAAAPAPTFAATAASARTSPAAPSSAHGAAVPFALSADDPAGLAPVLPPDVPVYFVPRPGPVVARTPYRAHALGVATVRFADRKTGVDVTREHVLLAPIDDTSVPVSWETSTSTSLRLDDLEAQPMPGIPFAELPSPAVQARNYKDWGKDLAEWLYANSELPVLYCPELETYARPDEDERAFRVRLGEASREERDRQTDALKAKYGPKMRLLEERLRKAEQRVDKEQTDASTGLAGTILGAVLGRRTVLGMAKEAARGVSRGMREREDVSRAKEDVAAAKEQIEALDRSFQDDIAAIEARIDPAAVEIETVSLRPTKANVVVRACALAWGM